MDNLTIVIKEGKREIAHQSSLYSEHITLFRNILNHRPSDIEGIEVWRAQRGREKVKLFTPAKNGKKFSVKSFLKMSSLAEAASQEVKELLAEPAKEEAPVTKEEV